MAKRSCYYADSSGLSESRGGVRHRIDGPGRAGAVARAGIASRDRKRVSQNRLDDEAIGRRRQSVAERESDVKDAELEIRNGDQGVLLVGKLCEVADPAKVRIIFETYEQVLAELSRDTCRGSKIRLTIFSEADAHNRVDDEF